MSRIEWTQTAHDDLTQVENNIAEDSTYYTVKFRKDVYIAIDRLEQFPMSGRIVPEFNDPSFREVLHGAYRIIYRLIDERVIILTVIHGKRRLPNTLI